MPAQARYSSWRTGLVNDLARKREEGFRKARLTIGGQLRILQGHAGGLHSSRSWQVGGSKLESSCVTISCCDLFLYSFGQ